MKAHIIRTSQVIEEKRFLWVGVMVILVSCSLMYRLWYLQIYNGSYYRAISERNRVRRIEIPAPRGVLYDRNGEVVLQNRPFYDLVYIPQYVQDKDVTFSIISRLLNIPTDILERRLKMARGQPKFLPIRLKRNLTLHEVSKIENNRVFLPGIEVRVAPRRDYYEAIPAHLVGYLREIDQRALKSFNKGRKEPLYLPGDLVGKQGLELKWEPHLRGRRGYRFIQVDAYGRQTELLESFQGIKLPTVKAQPGSDLELTIDMKLQEAVREAFKGKYGAVIVLDPRSGEVLAALSSPTFDPEMMQQGLSVEEWRSMTANPFKPFLDKTTGGEFPPGSIYKPVVAMAALEEGIVTPSTEYHCPGSFVLGDQTFACHHRAGHGTVNLRDALLYSCDVFFYYVGVELGVDRIAKYASSFGLGDKLGIDLNLERPGLIPTSAWKKLTYRFPWTKGDTPNISIGQGFNLMTPMQMVSLYAAIANGGRVWRPYYVRKVTDHIGAVAFENSPELVNQVEIISPETFELMRRYLRDVVHDPKGTGKAAYVPGTTVAGKTGSAQVVSLKKNRNQDDVSMKWKEHAIFTAFSPYVDPEIAVAVVSENDKVGGGGKSAAPIAQKIIKAYWDLKKARQLHLSRADVGGPDGG